MSKSLCAAFLRVLVVLFTTTLALTACGEDDSDIAKGACEAIEGETCMGAAQSSPEDLNTMLHLVGSTCATTGWNTYRLYAAPATAQGTMHAQAHGLVASMMADPTGDSMEFAVTAVAASMPSMGHGTAEPEKITSDHVFEIHYQMPGSWRIAVDFLIEGESTPRTAVWEVGVR